MKKFLSALSVMLLVCTLASAQSINKRYSSTMNAEGTIHFLRPYRLKKCDAMNGFEFDITYLSSEDSVTVNCTLEVKDPEKVSEMHLISGSKRLKGQSLKTFFCDVTKDGFNIRLSSRYKLSEWASLYASTEPIVFEFLVDDGTYRRATYKGSQWKTERENVTRIIKTINYKL